jgi:hypothetical protein
MMKDRRIVAQKEEQNTTIIFMENGMAWASDVDQKASIGYSIRRLVTETTCSELGVLKSVDGSSKPFKTTRLRVTVWRTVT